MITDEQLDNRAIAGAPTLLKGWMRSGGRGSVRFEPPANLSPAGIATWNHRVGLIGETIEKLSDREIEQLKRNVANWKLS
jgi:hypothetical protein